MATKKEKARAEKIKKRIADESTARRELTPAEFAATRRPRTRRQIISDFNALVVAEGIARMDMTPAEYMTIEDSPEYRRNGAGTYSLTATPDDFAKGQRGIFESSSFIRVAFASEHWLANAGKLEKAFFQFSPDEVIFILNSLQAASASRRWQAEALNTKAKAGKQSKRDARREKARAMFERIRKKESVNLYAKGPIVKRIARRLRISERTAKDYLAGLK